MVAQETQGASGPQSWLFATRGPLNGVEPPGTYRGGGPLPEPESVPVEEESLHDKIRRISIGKRGRVNYDIFGRALIDGDIDLNSDIEAKRSVLRRAGLTTFYGTGKGTGKDRNRIHIDGARVSLIASAFGSTYATYVRLLNESESGPTTI